MLGNPFEGRYDPLPPALAKRGFAQHLVRVADDVTLSYVRGPAHGEPLLLIPAQMGTWLTYARGRCRPPPTSSTRPPGAPPPSPWTEPWAEPGPTAPRVRPGAPADRPGVGR